MQALRDRRAGKLLAPSCKISPTAASHALCRCRFPRLSFTVPPSTTQSRPRSTAICRLGLPFFITSLCSHSPTDDTTSCSPSSIFHVLGILPSRLQGNPGRDNADSSCFSSQSPIRPSPGLAPFIQSVHSRLCCTPSQVPNNLVDPLSFFPSSSFCAG